MAHRTYQGIVLLAAIFLLIISCTPKGKTMRAYRLPDGQYRIEEDGKPVLQYNYQTVYEKDVIRFNDELREKPVEGEVSGSYRDEYISQHPGVPKDTLVTTNIYAVPRSDYIHPLFGLQGETLTRDWPIDGEPHHRGIWWAWPEVRYGSLQGDLYALQRIFARPTGKVDLVNSPDYAQIAAENRWMWEDKKPIVVENSVIRVYAATTDKRIIDITIRLTALEDSISIATRQTNSYGCFNIRMQSPQSQSLTHFTDQPGTSTLRSWSDLSGTFRDAGSPSGLSILQYKGNPDYPGPWVEYPNLAWVQPAFPAHGTRYPLVKGQPLVLRYRLVIHNGAKPDDAVTAVWWDEYHQPSAPLFQFDPSRK
jgi:hypothetical protein